MHIILSAANRWRLVRNSWTSTRIKFSVSDLKRYCRGMNIFDRKCLSVSCVIEDGGVKVGDAGRLRDKDVFCFNVHVKTVTYLTLVV